MKKLQVFVSSTYKDLVEERQTAVEAILDAGHIPAGMELFRAGKTQIETIRRWIDESDVYCLILGGRYGTVEFPEFKSYTQLEYEYAVGKGKPLFALVLTEDMLNEKAEKEGKAAVFEQEHIEEYKAFKKMVESHIVKFVTNHSEISKCIALELSAIYNSQEDQLTGWVKGSVDGELRRLENKIRKAPCEARLYMERAEHLFSVRGGDMRQAVSDCLYAAFLELDNPECYYKLIRWLAKESDRDRALRLAEEVCRLFPDEGRAYAHRAYAKYYKGQYHESMEDCERALSLRKDYWCYNIRGCCHMQLGEYCAALDDFAEENLAVARQGLAAEDSLRKIFSKMGAEKIIQLALEEKARENIDRAEVYIKIVTHLAPENEQGLREFGGLYYDRKQYALALKYWEKALELNRSCRNYYLCAAALKGEGNLFKAKKYCGHALQCPDDGYHELAKQMVDALGGL